MEEGIEWVQAVERDDVKGAKDADAWAVPRLPDLPGTAFVAITPAIVITIFWQ
jgi:hypothetical protein